MLCGHSIMTLGLWQRVLKWQQGCGQKDRTDQWKGQLWTWMSWVGLLVVKTPTFACLSLRDFSHLSQICAVNYFYPLLYCEIIVGSKLTAVHEEKCLTNKRRELETSDKMMKRTACHWQVWAGCTRSKREKYWDLASHFVDRLNKSIKACWSTLIELHKWDWGVHTAKRLQSSDSFGETTAWSSLWNQSSMPAPACFSVIPSSVPVCFGTVVLFSSITLTSLIGLSFLSCTRHFHQRDSFCFLLTRNRTTEPH